ncbi:hypothetical protein E2C01_090242 [Portunus trituberculatus]|uniref:Uncharacterized protein n=1 Tax=Portunus trituberculatus TaxID=210409 RepID=A0A5B7JPM4_PORTR|nr:hypothetical protein [Portunus trituberculatus]
MVEASAADHVGFSRDKGGFLGYLLSQSPPTRKPLPRVRKPNLNSDRGQDSNPCAWRPLGPQSTHGSIVPRRPISICYRISTYSVRGHVILFCVSQVENRNG